MKIEIIWAIAATLFSVYLAIARFITVERYKNTLRLFEALENEQEPELWEGLLKKITKKMLTQRMKEKIKQYGKGIASVDQFKHVWDLLCYNIHQESVRKAVLKNLETGFLLKKARDLGSIYAQAIFSEVTKGSDLAEIKEKIFKIVAIHGRNRPRFIEFQEEVDHQIEEHLLNDTHQRDESKMMAKIAEFKALCDLNNGHP